MNRRKFSRRLLYIGAILAGLAVVTADSPSPGHYYSMVIGMLGVGFAFAAVQLDPDEF